MHASAARQTSVALGPPPEAVVLAGKTYSSFSHACDDVLLHTRGYNMRTCYSAALKFIYKQNIISKKIKNKKKARKMSFFMKSKIK